MPVDTYKTQNRGGRGIKGMSTNEDDIVDSMINMSTHDDLLFFTNLGKVYRIKGYNVPEFGRTAKGLPVVNLLNLDKEETDYVINSVLEKKRVEKKIETENGYVGTTLFVNGKYKKVSFNHSKVK